MSAIRINGSCVRIAALFSIMTLVAVSGCMIGVPGVIGSGVSKSEPRTVDAFAKLRLEGSADVTVNVAGPGAKREVIVTTDDNILTLIDTDVRDGTLVIGSHDSFQSKVGVKVVVTVESLDAVGIAGSGNVRVSGAKSSKFTATISGSGNVNVSGDGDAIECRVTGSGNVDATSFTALKATAIVTGSGNIEVRATDAIDAKVTGSGDIIYAGDPKNVQRKVTGSGSVKAK